MIKKNPPPHIVNSRISPKHYNLRISPKHYHFKYLPHTLTFHNHVSGPALTRSSPLALVVALLVVLSVLLSIILTVLAIVTISSLKL